MSVSLADLKVKLFTVWRRQGADRGNGKQPHIAGFTTNPSLLRKAGVTDYEAYARDMVAAVPAGTSRSRCFPTIRRDPRPGPRHRHLGQHVHVKLPITTTKGESLLPMVRDLVQDGVKVNLTAIFRRAAGGEGVAALAGGAPSIISVFAGRLADSGHRLCAGDHQGGGTGRGRHPMWRSSGPPPARVWNVIEADRMGTLITAPADVLKKLPGAGQPHGRRTLAGRGQGVPRRCPRARPDPRSHRPPAAE